MFVIIYPQPTAMRVERALRTKLRFFIRSRRSVTDVSADHIRELKTPTAKIMNCKCFFHGSSRPKMYHRITPIQPMHWNTFPMQLIELDHIKFNQNTCATVRLSVAKCGTFFHFLLAKKMAIMKS